MQHIICPNCRFAYLVQHTDEMRCHPGRGFEQRCPQCAHRLKLRYLAGDPNQTSAVVTPQQPRPQATFAAPKPRTKAASKSQAAAASGYVPMNVWLGGAVLAACVIVVMAMAVNTQATPDLPISRASSSYFVGTPTLALAFSDWGAAGMLLMAFGLTVLYLTHLRVHRISMPIGTYIVAIGLTAIVGCGLTLFFQWYGGIAGRINLDSTPTARIGCLWAVFVIAPSWMASTYGRLVADASGWSLFANFFAGVGMFEELAKAIAGIMLFRMVGGPELRSRAQQSVYAVACFFVAGLGFAVGENILYYAGFAGNGIPLSIYALRAWWCVALHGSWAAISGLLLKPMAAREITLQSLGDNWASGIGYVLLLALGVMPAAFLHAAYNTAAFKGYPLMWIVGLISIALAFAIIAWRASVGDDDQDDDEAEYHDPPSRTEVLSPGRKAILEGLQRINSPLLNKTPDLRREQTER